MRKQVILVFFIALGLLPLGQGCAHQPTSAEQVLARSVEAHGGKALSQWKTMIIRGEVNQRDNRLRFRGEYILYAQKPDKLRIEKDLTKFERGRFFVSEIYNNGKGWMLRNLIPVYREEMAKEYKAHLDRCDGIAFYAANATSLALLPPEEVDGRPAHVVEASAGGRTARLYIDKETFYLVREIVDNLELVYSDFEPFGDTIRASRIREITTRDGPEEVQYAWNTIELDVAIAPELFEEEMPGE